jgi:Trp operon repressor
MAGSVTANFNTAVAGIMKGSDTANAMIEKAPEDQKEFLKLQQQMQREGQVVQLITSLMKKDDENKKAILGNLR